MALVRANVRAAVPVDSPNDTGLTMRVLFASAHDWRIQVRSPNSKTSGLKLSLYARPRIRSCRSSSLASSES